MSDPKIPLVLCSSLFLRRTDALEYAFTSGDIAGAVIGSVLSTVVVLCLIGFLFYRYFRLKHGGESEKPADFFWPFRRGKNPPEPPEGRRIPKTTRFTSSVFVPGKGILSSGPPKSEFSYANKAYFEPDEEAQIRSKSVPPLRGNNEEGRTAVLRHESSVKRRVSRRDKFKEREDSNLTRVKLRGHDFAGLGFNIAGNLRDGIYVQNVLQRGPAAESGVLEPGDRIMDVTVSFKNIVFEDALTILSYASPYDVTLSVKKDVDPGRKRRLSADQVSVQSWQPPPVAERLFEKSFGTLKRSQSNGDLDAISRNDSTSSDEHTFWDPGSGGSKPSRLVATTTYSIGVRPSADSPSISPQTSIRHSKMTSSPTLSTRQLYDTAPPPSDRPRGSLTNSEPRESIEEVVTYSKVSSPKKKAAPPPPPPLPMKAIKQVEVEYHSRPLSSVSISSVETSSSLQRKGSAVEEMRSIGASSMLNEILQEYDREREHRQSYPPVSSSSSTGHRSGQYQTYEMTWTEGSESDTSSMLDRHHERISMDPRFGGDASFQGSSSQSGSFSHDNDQQGSQSQAISKTSTRLILPVNMEPTSPTSFASDDGSATRKDTKSNLEPFAMDKKPTRY